MGGSCSTYGGEEIYVQGFGGEFEVKRQLGRYRVRWEDNIKWNFRKWYGESWIGLMWFRRDRW
jgi:hypothetical protein